MKIFHFGKKHFVFREGFSPAGLFIIIKGKVKIFKSAYNGKDVIISIVRENEIIGYSNLIAQTEYRTSACATEATVVGFLSKKIFFDLIEKDREFSLSLMKNFSKEYDHALDKLINLATKQARKRIAEMLLRLLKKHGTEKDKQTLKIVLSREELAQLVATNTETLVRTLTEFRKENLIRLKGKRISIVDAKQLSKSAKIF
jgi:CRP/FNR family transcriptional regulator